MSVIIYMRKRRLLVNGADYHVVARANRQEHILRSSLIKEMMLDVILEAKSKYSFHLKNFCIMGNHIHLIINPQGKESLSRIMQWILSVFAIRFNKLCGYKGHVWYDRFRSKVIESFRQYLATFIYVSQNPVRVGMAKESADYSYGGFHHLRNKHYKIIEPPDTDTMIAIFWVLDAS